jgi:hypothetical protein
VIHIPADQPTMQVGIDMSIPGDTVLVSPGTYNETLWFGRDSILVMSISGPYFTLLTGAVNGPGRECAITGFQITGGVQAKQNWTITNCWFLEFSNGISIDGDSIRVHRCLFKNVAGVAAGGDGIHFEFINNTVDGCNGGLVVYGDNSVIKNNIVTNSSEYGIYGVNSSSILDYNDLWNNHPDYAGGSTPGLHDISRNPLYRNPGVYDYGLYQFSPCIDAGDPSPQYNDPDGTRNDMGAFYFSINRAPTAVTLALPGNTLWPPLPSRRPTFVWTTATDPDLFDTVTYNLTIAIDPDFLFVQQISNVTDTSHTLTADLQWGKQYWWNVTACDRHGGETRSPQIFTFRIMTLGDASGDGSVDISDCVFLINYIFSGGEAPNPLITGDANCEGPVDISDVVYLITYIFAGGPAPCNGVF